jgi:hypothetical protein
MDDSLDIPDPDRPLKSNKQGGWGETSAKLEKGRFFHLKL